MAPKRPAGVGRGIGAVTMPAYQPTNAAASIIPSIPMLTTPDRSHMTPHRAPSASGVAARRMIGAMTGGCTAIEVADELEDEPE